jgi:hypothetical protein
LDLESLWAGRVPLAMITMFAGDPKLGKSFVTLHISTESTTIAIPLIAFKDGKGFKDFSAAARAIFGVSCDLSPDPPCRPNGKPRC